MFKKITLWLLFASLAVAATSSLFAAAILLAENTKHGIVLDSFSIYNYCIVLGLIVLFIALLYLAFKAACSINTILLQEDLLEEGTIILPLKNKNDKFKMASS